MTSFDGSQLRMYLQQIRESLDGIERLIGEQTEAQPDPYARRQRLLEHVYAQEGLDREQLVRALREAGTAYQWIGQQVKKRYLSITPLPNGKVRYTVTPKAVKDLDLDKGVLDDAEVFTAMADEAFAEDWDSPEDAVYDRL